MRKSTVSVMVSSIVLSACGGGGSTEPTSKATASNVPTVVSEPVELVSNAPILLPDLKAKYDRLCGRKTNIQNAIVVDINKDGKMDLIFNLWCLQDVMGVMTDGDVPNGLVALMQNSDGTFTDKTLEVFGNDLPSIGGIGIDSVVEDFNGDGIKDIVFAVNREDGRLPSKEVMNHKASTIALMSDGRGGYKIEKVSEPIYGYRITLKENSSGKKDIILMPFETSSAYTYNNGWKKLSNFEWVSNHSSTFFSSPNTGTGSTTAVVPSGHPRTGVELWTGANNSWTKISEYKFPEPILVYQKGWNGSVGLVPMFTIDGKDYVAPSISDTCELKRTRNGPSEALTIFSAGLLINGYVGQTLIEGDKTMMKQIHKIMLFDTNFGTTISKVNITINNEVDTGQIWKVECPDINGDGLSDIAYYQPQGGPPSGGDVTYPAILMNDGNGNYQRVSSKWFPRPPNGTSYVYEDINGDGIKDLLYFPLTGYTGSDADNSLPYGHIIKQNSVTFHLYVGKRHIKSSDMMQ